MTSLRDKSLWQFFTTSLRDMSSRQVFATSLRDKSSRQVFATSLRDKSSWQVFDSSLHDKWVGWISEVSGFHHFSRKLLEYFTILGLFPGYSRIFHAFLITLESCSTFGIMKSLNFSSSHLHFMRFFTLFFLAQKRGKKCPNSCKPINSHNFLEKSVNGSQKSSISRGFQLAAFVLEIPLVCFDLKIPGNSSALKAILRGWKTVWI